MVHDDPICSDRSLLRGTVAATKDTYRLNSILFHHINKDHGGRPSSPPRFKDIHYQSSLVNPGAGRVRKPVHLKPTGGSISGNQESSPHIAHPLPKRVPASFGPAGPTTADAFHHSKRYKSSTSISGALEPGLRSRNIQTKPDARRCRTEFNNTSYITDHLLRPLRPALPSRLRKLALPRPTSDALRSPPAGVELLVSSICILCLSCRGHRG